ncbi:adenylate/guanylate cyclase domain-containing protein [Leifsonia sp. LS1]|uniref:adenylate/guanylate cyclase domain-containing protein n=1 Tax=Leifsonia sp. LS1 TaxID=2828483 RepID=UPI001CFC54CD|nr:adenylate/guanylate cyclase domain-containing protein [Leifsonia sp. LS1]GIT80774.1 adenylate/guanylate cyclase domain-containing protein [Leifsonia sp. LS1]
MESSVNTEPTLPVPPRKPFRRRRGLTIQSKLLVMLLVVGVGATAVTGFISYYSSAQSLREAAFDQLTSVRANRSAEVQRLFSSVRSAVALASSNASAAEASNAFNAGFSALATSSIEPGGEQSLTAYYTDQFLPKVTERTAKTYAVDSFLPTDPAARYLQAKYTAVVGSDYQKALDYVDPADQGPWSAANATYGPYFADLATKLSFNDVLLLNTTGDIVYSAYKGVDLGTNVETGPFRDSLLADAYEEALRSNTVDTTVTTDFQNYLPAFDEPVLWIVSPVGRDGVVTGALAFQIDVSAINDVMTGGTKWQAQGLGKTGESYLVGPGSTMRSTSRLLVESPKTYRTAVVDAGTAPSVADQIVRTGDPILLQPIETTAAKEGLRGETGLSTETGYTGREALMAYAPLRVQGLDWAIVAQMDTSEAFAPVNQLTQALLIAIIVIVIAVCLLSLGLAQVFLRPIRRLHRAVEETAGGELGTQVDVRSTDEIGDLGRAFNDLSRSLQTKDALLQEEKRQHQDLLRTMMPDDVARRFQGGEETIADDHAGVAVLFADVDGFEQYSRGRESAESLATLNSIFRAFDDEANRLGVEPVRSTRQQGYLASCGLTVRRVDAPRRMVEFALAADRVVRRFNAQLGVDLRLRAGIDFGTVTSGLVGRSGVMFDMWGDTVDLAHRAFEGEERSGIFVTARVAAALPSTIDVVQAEEAADPQTGEPLWRVLPAADAEPTGR